MATHDCAPYELRDPRALNLRDMAEGREADEIVTALRGAKRVPRLLGFSMVIAYASFLTLKVMIDKSGAS